MISSQALNAEDAEVAQKSQKDSRMEADLTREIIGAAVEVQRVLGVGLLESAYTSALGIELAQRGIEFEYEVPIHASYKGQPLGVVYRSDMVVARSVILEIEAVQGVAESHRAQLLSYAAPLRPEAGTPAELSRLSDGQVGHPSRQ